jgi:DNA-binding MarR family transcriptional regulator
MLAEIVKRLAQQFDAAQRTLNELRIKSRCDTFPETALQTERRYEVAYRAAVQSRRLRANHFSSQDMFGEPAWDILLDLYIHQIRNDEVSVKSANFDSSAPASTEQRWFRILEDQNLIFSVEDPTNPRRCFIRLTPAGYESLTRYLNEIGR